VLLPPERTPERPLPSWVAWVAVLGLLVLCSSVIPAVLEHRRLDAYREELADVTRRRQESLRTLHRQLHAARHDLFVRHLALDRLLHPPRER
jgi:hypothetical protein